VSVELMREAQDRLAPRITAAKLRGEPPQNCAGHSDAAGGDGGIAGPACALLPRDP
jgi:hypothetical protein